MNRSEARRWITAVALFAIVLQAFLAPGIAGAPPVNLALQLTDAGIAAAGVAPASLAHPDAATATPLQPHPASDAPYCPYWCGVWDLAHAGGLLAAAAPIDPTTASPEAPKPLRSLGPTSSAAGEQHRARAPPLAA